MTQPRPPIHPVIAKAQADFQNDLVEEVSKVIATEKVVVVGVSGLQPGKKARKLLEAKGVPHRYLEYGSYFKGWRRRLALKIWVGWPTFPLVFIKGTFVGGASDLKALSESGELDKLLAE
ncbi:MAG: glutaredoxin [Archangium sp.]|nr:glutaredoxin [Archangium sp.]